MFVLAGADSFFGAYVQRELINAHLPFLALNHRFCLHPSEDTVNNMPFELTDENSLECLKNKLKNQKELKIIYLIAAHNVDFVKSNPTLSSKINGEYYRRFLDALPQGANITLYYVSSDTVYGESINGRVFGETDERSPVNVYGEQKCMAEDITLTNGFSVVRCPYLFGKSLTQKTHFFDTLLQKLSNGEGVDMFTDYIRNSISYQTAAELLVALLKVNTPLRVFNLCADKAVSKYDIGLYAARLVGAQSTFVRPMRMSESDVFTEKRASCIYMSNNQLKTVLQLQGEIKSFEESGEPQW